MKLPGQLETEYAIKGLWAAAIAALFLIVLAFAGVQTVRLEGLKVWPVSIEGARPKAARLERDLKNIGAAQKLADEAQKRERLRWEERYRKLAEEADDNAQQTIARAADDATRFIAANRVRGACPAGGGTGAARTAAGGGRAAGGDRPGEVPFVDDRPALRPGEEQLFPDLVAVSPEDVRACTRNTARLLDAQGWGVTLERESAAAVKGPG